MELASTENIASAEPVRVMYSFPNRLGAGRICWTALQQVKGLVDAGAAVSVVAASALIRPEGVENLVTTLATRNLRFPCRFIGSRRAAILHDWISSKWLEKNVNKIDLVHVWPLGGLRTISVARRYGIPVLLERPNAHTGFAYDVVSEECALIGLNLPEGYEHQFDARVLDREIKEYDSCDYLLCPSEFVKQTFLEREYPEARLLKHQYGYDLSRILPGHQSADADEGLVVIYAGLCTPRKGLHYALQAWRASEASRRGKFLVCGNFVPGYRELLEDLLTAPGVEVLGHRTDLSQWMSQSSIFLLPSVEEGSALVTYEARGAGCVLVVSDASGAICNHMEDGLIHRARDVSTLTTHLNLLDGDRQLLSRMRAASLKTIDHLTWTFAGKRLNSIYKDVLAAR